MSETLIKGKGYVHALDGIRFFAVFMVLIKHTGLGASSNVLPVHVIGILAKEGTGVPLFFVVSGFLITSILMRTKSTENRYGNFLARRSLRIFPCYYLYLGGAALATWVTLHHGIQHPWVYLAYLQNVFLSLSDANMSAIPVYHLWTLSVQEQFYVLWPLLIWSCKSLRGVRAVCWVVVGLSLACRIWVWIHFGQRYSELLMPCRAGEMAMGGLFALETLDPTMLSRHFYKLLWPTAAVCCIIIISNLDDYQTGVFCLHEMIAIFSTALLASALIPATLPARVLAWKPLADVGRKYSYGLFIYHPVVLKLVILYVPINMHSWLGGIVRLVITVVISVFVAKLSYTYFERHFLHLKRFFEPKGKLKEMPLEA